MGGDPSSSEHVNLVIALLHGWTNQPDISDQYTCVYGLSTNQPARHDLYDMNYGSFYTQLPQIFIWIIKVTDFKLYTVCICVRSVPIIVFGMFRTVFFCPSQTRLNIRDFKAIFDPYMYLEMYSSCLY
jgi:hypothetical protein